MFITKDRVTGSDLAEELLALEHDRVVFGGQSPFGRAVEEKINAESRVVDGTGTKWEKADDAVKDGCCGEEEGCTTEA